MAELGKESRQEVEIDDPNCHVLMPTATLHMIMERLGKLEADNQGLQEEVKVGP